MHDNILTWSACSSIYPKNNLKKFFFLYFLQFIFFKTKTPMYSHTEIFIYTVTGVSKCTITSLVSCKTKLYNFDDINQHINRRIVICFDTWVNMRIYKLDFRWNVSADMYTFKTACRRIQGMSWISKCYRYTPAICWVCLCSVIRYLYNKMCYKPNLGDIYNWLPL